MKRKRNSGIIAIMVFTVICLTAIFLPGCPEPEVPKIELNYAALDAAITDAQAAKDGITISEDGNFVSETEKWVTASVMQTFNNAIAEAETTKVEAKTQAQIDAAVTALNAAIAAFNDAKQDGNYSGSLDFTAINLAITEAEAAKDGIEISEDGSDVPPADQWVTEDVMEAFDEAIAAALDVRETAADQALIDAAVTALNTAISVFNDAKQNGETLDLTALDEAIADAEAAKDGIEISDTADFVPLSRQWVTAEVMQTFEDAIDAAETAKEEAETQADIEAALTALNTAISVFNDAKQDGTSNSHFIFTEINAAILNAEAAKVGIAVSNNGGDVLPADKWVTPAVLAALNDAISAAETVRNQATSQEEIDEAVTALEEATDEFINAQENGTLTVFGVMSDIRIGGSVNSEQSPALRLERAYQRFTRENPNMEAVVALGSLTNSGTIEQFEIYKDIMQTHSSAQRNLLTLGNLDNSEVDGNDAQERFFEVFDQEAAKVTKINGYHFITINTRDDEANTSSLSYHKSWMEARLAEAHAEDPDLPIFVFQHHPEENNLLGSTTGVEPGSGLHDIYSQYPQVVLFSGRSYISFADPRAIWQEDYTAIHTGALYQTGLDRHHPLTTLTPRAGYTDTMHNALNVTVLEPYNRGDSSTALIVEVSGTQVTVRRIDMFWDTEIATKFVFDTSVNKNQFPYREAARISASNAPQFGGGAQISFTPGEKRFSFTFPQAQNTSSSIGDDGAHFYKVTVKNAESGDVLHNYNLHGGHYMFPRPTTVKFDSYGVGIVAGGQYEVSITPVGFFGKEGNTITGTVTNLPADSIPYTEETFGINVQGLADMVCFNLGILGTVLNATGMGADTILNNAMPGITVQAVYDIFGQPVLFNGGTAYRAGGLFGIGARPETRNYGTMQIPVTGSTTLYADDPTLFSIWDPDELFDFL